MLSEQAALSSTLSTFILTAFTVYGVIAYDDNFIATTSVWWITYVFCSAITYALALLMSLFQNNGMAYICTFFAWIGIVSLSVWFWNQGSRRHVNIVITAESENDQETLLQDHTEDQLSS